MKALLLSTLLATALPLTAEAAAPPDAPPGTTARCKDGSFYQGERQGACKDHRGVKDWYGTATPPARSSADTPTAAKPAPAPVPTPKSAPTSKPTPAPTPAPSSSERKPPQPAARAAPGANAGKVWVNANSKVYHCPGDRWYGKTKDGRYLSEADAKAEGYKGPRGQDCR